MNRKTLPLLNELPPTSRRRVLQALGALALAPAAKHAARELLIGSAYAQTADPGTLFVEINYRDQVDLGQVFVAPGLATATNLIRGERGRACAMFIQQNEMTRLANDVYLTPDSAVLAPHVDNIACVDLCELTPGAIHNHNGANRNRAPDCSYDHLAGMGPMFENDPVSNFPQGCEEYYSAVPTPASMHNYAQKLLTPGLQNGVALKGITRSIHTVYHYAATLGGAA
jgi:hypothetical protein